MAHEHIIDRRKPTRDETIQLWLNIISAVCATVPMIATDLKPLLPQHYYGLLASGALTVNAVIDVYRRWKYGKVITVEVPDENH